jgi:CRP-like cAMP-binding protein
MDRNQLLADLMDKDRAALTPHLQEVELRRGGVVSEAGDVMPYVYFPVEGVLSLVGATEGGATVELADIGREGVANLSALLGGSWLPFRVVTKVGGQALRVPTDVVVKQLRECGELQLRVMSFANGLIAQIGQAAVCNRYHNAKQRLARWILSTAERSGDTFLPLTHEFISSLVGGPRSAVTEASADLREIGAIEYCRGLLEVKDLERLRQESCECYAAVAEGRQLEEEKG